MARPNELASQRHGDDICRMSRSTARRSLGLPWISTALFSIIGLLTTGCITIGAVPYTGFEAVQPKQTFLVMSEQMKVPKVKSIQPELVWRPFPGAHQFCKICDKEPFITVDLNKVSEITYHLRIWNAPNLAPGEIVYDRRGLAETRHRLEQPLEPNAVYFWSVRAEFKYDGNTQLTEWSLSNLPTYPLPFGNFGAYGTGSESGRTVAQRIGTIPPRNYYRFRT